MASVVVRSLIGAPCSWRLCAIGPTLHRTQTSSASVRWMAEAFARVGEIDICYETFGDPSDPAMLLIMGLGTQMLAWHEDFCEQLAARGFYVIRHDNRDIGR